MNRMTTFIEFRVFLCLSSFANPAYPLGVKQKLSPGKGSLAVFIL